MCHIRNEKWACEMRNEKCIRNEYRNCQNLW